MPYELAVFLKDSDPQRGHRRENHLCGGGDVEIGGQACETPSKPTLLKTNISSSQTGSREFPLDVLVLYFLFVSAGSPNMSTSTYTPTFLSIKNWPEITWRTIRTYLVERGALQRSRTPRRRPYFYLDGVGDDPVHDVFRERVEVFVRPPHELGFQQVAASPVVFEHAHVQLHREVWERNGREEALNRTRGR